MSEYTRRIKSAYLSWDTKSEQLRRNSETSTYIYVIERSKEKDEIEGVRMCARHSLSIVPAIWTAEHILLQHSPWCSCPYGIVRER